MLFSKLAVAVVSLPYLAQSMPAFEVPNLEILEQFTQDEGITTITVYGDADSLSSRRSSITEATSLDRRCGSMQVTCDNSNEARRKNCNLLVDQLVGDRTPLQSSQRSICLDFNGSRCCVSWHDAVQGAVWENLVPAARAGLDKCRGDTGVSAKATDTLLGATCTDQCLSDRPEWC